MEVAGTGIGRARARIHSGRGDAALSPVSNRHRLRTLLAVGAANGLPSVMTIRTSAAIVRATSRAMIPPRLHPTRLTGRPVAARRRDACWAIAGRSASARRMLRPRFQPCTSYPRLARNRRIATVERSSAPNPGRTITPWCWPRGAVARKGAAASSAGMSSRPRTSSASRRRDGGSISSSALIAIASSADRRLAAAPPLARRAPVVLFLVKLLLVELADRRFRQVGPDLHRLHHLVLAELVLEKDLELVECQGGRIALQFDEGLGRLATIRIMNADDADLLDGRMLEYGLLDDARVDVIAAAKQHVLGAVDDIDIAVCIHVTDIASAQEPVGSHHDGRGFWILPVTLHHVGAFDADLAALSQRDVFAVAGDAGELDDDSRNGNAARARPWRPLRRREGAGGGRLGHAPALREPASGEVLKSPLDLERQRRAAGGAPFHRR